MAAMAGMAAGARSLEIVYILKHKAEGVGWVEEKLEMEGRNNVNTVLMCGIFKKKKT